MGVTNTELHRLRQHNGVAKGGAWFTKILRNQGEWLFALRIQNITRWQSRSLEARVKFWKKKKNNIKGSPVSKWLRVIEPFIADWPDAVVNKTTESILDLEIKEDREKRLKKG